jgi:hypothetical protein
VPKIASDGEFKPKVSVTDGGHALGDETYKTIQVVFTKTDISPALNIPVPLYGMGAAPPVPAKASITAAVTVIAKMVCFPLFFGINRRI